MISYTGILLLVLLGGVQSKKLSLKSHEAEAYYHPQAPLFLPLGPAPLPAPLPIQPQPARQVESLATKGGSFLQQEREILPRPAQLAPLAPQALAYVIIRPIQPQYQFLEPLRVNQMYPQPLRPMVPVYREPQLASGIKGAPEIKEEIQQAPIEQQQIHQEEIRQEEVEPAPTKSGKFSKLKSHFDQLAASAKAKLTLGSSYRVVSEEIVQQPMMAPEQPVQQQQEEFIPEQEPERQVPATKGIQQEKAEQLVEVKGQRVETIQQQQVIEQSPKSALKNQS